MLVATQKEKQFCDKPRHKSVTVANELSSARSTMDLIVDFPQGHRVSLVSKRVSFAGTCHVKYVKSLLDFTQKSALWYSNRDIDIMKYQILLTVEKLKAEHITMAQYAEKNIQDTSTFLGLEKMLSDHVIKRLSVVKTEHRKGVLAEERRQVSLGIYDAYAISSVSMASSEWSRKRASVLGLLHADET